MITICFTQGHISIKRSRKTRQYTPTPASYYRLTALTAILDGSKYTNRSTFYEWQSEKTLSPIQSDMLRTFRTSKLLSPTYAHIPEWYKGYVAGLRVACLHLNIPTYLLDK